MNIDEVTEAFYARKEVEILVPVGPFRVYEWISAHFRQLCRNFDGAQRQHVSVELVHYNDRETSGTLYTFRDEEIPKSIRLAPTVEVKLATALERIQELARQRDDAMAAEKKAIHDRDVAIAALDFLKKEIGYKADALADVRAGHFTFEVVTRHIAALRRLT